MKKKLYLVMVIVLVLGIVPLHVFAQADDGISTDGLDLWLKADAGVAQSGGNVVGWTSQTVDGATFATSGSGQAITLVESPEGHSYLNFNGNGSLTATTKNYNGKNAITLIVVAEYDGSDPPTDAYADISTALFWAESGGWGSMSLAPYNRQVQMRFGVGSNAGVSRYSAEAAPGLSSYAAIKNGTTHSLFINNVGVLSEGGKPATTSGIATTMYVGQGISNGANRYFTGKIAEVLVYDRALRTAELERINMYFAEKYGIDVVPKTPSSLEVTPPTKQHYEVGESFDPAGIGVKLRYTNGEVETLTAGDYTISGFESALKGKKPITVSLIADPSIKGSFFVTVGNSLKIVSAAAAPVSVPKGTAASKLILPFSIDVTLDGYFDNITQPTLSTRTKVPVVWDTSTFNPNKLNTPQTVYGNLNLTLGKSVKDSVTRTDLPIGNPDGVRAEIVITVRDVEREIYVSPTAPDGGNGTAGSPFNSIKAAKDAIAGNGWNSDMGGDILVWLGGGTYKVTEPIQFGPGDSGSNGYSIIYQAVPGEVPNLDGGITVDEWQRWDKNPNIYVAPLDRDRKLRNLFVNGEAAAMTTATARTRGPYGKVVITGDEDWALDAGVETAGALLKWSDIGFTVDSPEKLTNPDDIEIRQARIWNEVVVGIAEIKSVPPGDDGGAPPPKASTYAANMWTNPGQEAVNLQNLNNIINSPANVALRMEGDTAFILQQPYGAIAACLQWQCNFMPYFAYLSFGGNSVQGTAHPNFVIQNSLELLKSPGQFYFDKRAQRLYYYPKEGENIHTSEIIVPVSEGLIRIHGKDTKNRVENLQFSGIMFTSDDKGLEVAGNSEGFASVQNMAAYVKYAENGDWHSWLYNMTDLPKGTVDVENAKGIVFSGNVFTNLSSSTCIGYINDVSESYITGNLFAHTAGNAVCIGHTQHVHIGEDAPPETLKDEKYPVGVEGICKDIIVSNNYIDNICTMFPQADALTALFAENVEFSHNRIANVPYSGINFGWGWQNQDDRHDYRGTAYPDYPSRTAKKNTIVYNDISRTNLVLPHDGGPLYTLGHQEDSILAYNHVTGTRSLYTDEGTAYFEVFGNYLQSYNDNEGYDMIFYGNGGGAQNAFTMVRGNARPAITSPDFTSQVIFNPSSATVLARAGVSAGYADDIERLLTLVSSSDNPGETQPLLFYDFDDQSAGAVNSSNNDLIGPFGSGGLSIVDESGDKSVRIYAASGTGHHGFYLKDVSWKNALIQLDFKYGSANNFTHDWEALSVQGFAQASDLYALANTENLFAGAYLERANTLYRYHYNTGTPGSHINGDTVPFTVTKETWYRIKIMTKDGKYYTKVWPRDGAEPAQWQVSGNIPAEAGNIGTLRVKTYKHQTGSVIDMSFDNIRVETITRGAWPDEVYTITIDSNIANGSVSVNKNHDLPAGTTVTITATPDDGYFTRQILVNGLPVEVENNKATFEITEETTVSATFDVAVPPTGISDMTGPTVTLIVLVVVSAALWIYIARRKHIKQKND